MKAVTNTCIVILNSLEGNATSTINDQIFVLLEKMIPILPRFWDGEALLPCWDKIVMWDV